MTPGQLYNQKTANIRIDRTLYQKLVKHARRDGRTLKGLVEYMAKHYQHCTGGGRGR